MNQIIAEKGPEKGLFGCSAKYGKANDSIIISPNIEDINVLTRRKFDEICHLVGETERIYSNPDY